MRAIAAVTVIAAVIHLYAAQLQAAPASIAAPQQNFTPLKQLVQGVYRYDSTNGYLPACPSGLFLCLPLRAIRGEILRLLAGR